MKTRSSKACLTHGFTIFLACAVLCGAQAALAERQPTVKTIKPYANASQLLKLKGRITVDDTPAAGHGGIFKGDLALKAYSNVVEFSSAGKATEIPVEIVCDPNQTEPVLSDGLGDHFVYVSPKQDGNTLRVHVNPRGWRSNVLRVRIRTPDVLTIGAAGSTRYIVKADSLTLLRVRFAGSSTVEASGSARFAEFDGAGSNTYSAANFTVQECAVSTAGNSFADVRPVKSLYVVGTTGRCDVHGHPKQVEEITGQPYKLNFL